MQHKSLSRHPLRPDEDEFRHHYKVEVGPEGDSVELVPLTPEAENTLDVINFEYHPGRMIWETRVINLNAMLDLDRIYTLGFSKLPGRLKERVAAFKGIVTRYLIENKRIVKDDELDRFLLMSPVPLSRAQVKEQFKEKHQRMSALGVEIDLE